MKIAPISSFELSEVFGLAALKQEGKFFTLDPAYQSLIDELNRLDEPTREEVRRLSLSWHARKAKRDKVGRFR